MKPRQPDWLKPIFGANSGRRKLLEDESDCNVANSLFSGRGFLLKRQRVSHLSRDPFLIPGHRMHYYSLKEID